MSFSFCAIYCTLSQIAMVDQMNAMGFDPLQLAKVLSNPDMVKMLQILAGSGAAT